MSFNRNFDDLVYDDDTHRNQHREECTQFHKGKCRILGHKLSACLEYGDQMRSYTLQPMEWSLLQIPTICNKSSIPKHRRCNYLPCANLASMLSVA